MDTEPRKISELQDEVYEAIDYAKAQIEDLSLFETLNVLSDTWNMLQDEFMIMSVALLSLKDKPKEDIEKFLTVVRANGV